MSTAAEFEVPLGDSPVELARVERQYDNLDKAIGVSLTTAGAGFGSAVATMVYASTCKPTNHWLVEGINSEVMGSVGLGALSIVAVGAIGLRMWRLHKVLYKP